MPKWWSNFTDGISDKMYEKVFIPIFGGYDKKDEDSEEAQSVAGSGNQAAIAMQTFQRRASGHQRQHRAPGFDYIHWKPYGKKRHRYYPNEYATRCLSLAPYVKATAYAGHLGLEERRWAGEGLEPLPLGARGPLSSVPASLQGSRDILSKMGPGPAVK